MTFKPVYGNIVVEELKTEETSKGGIVLAGSKESKGKVGVVVAVGPGRMLNDGKIVPVCVNVGDKVFLGCYADHVMEIKGESFLVINEEDILCILEGD